MQEPSEPSKETTRRYVKFKAKKIKEARNSGNHALAERHATELLQFFGFGGETPIESEVENV